MKLYRFLEPDNQKAMAKVHKTLGPEALIYSTKRIAEGIEILAGLPQHGEPQPIHIKKNIIDNKLIEDVSHQVVAIREEMQKLTKYITDLHHVVAHDLITARQEARKDNFVIVLEREMFRDFFKAIINPITYWNILKKIIYSKRFWNTVIRILTSKRLWKFIKFMINIPKKLWNFVKKITKPSRRWIRVKIIRWRRNLKEGAYGNQQII